MKRRFGFVEMSREIRDNYLDIIKVLFINSVPYSLQFFTNPDRIKYLICSDLLPEITENWEIPLYYLVVNSTKNDDIQFYFYDPKSEWKSKNLTKTFVFNDLSFMKNNEKIT